MIFKPMSVPGLGDFAIFQDPDGVMMALFEERSDVTQA